MEEIDQLSQKMEKETKALKDEIFRVCWFMRGSVSVSEAYEMTQEDFSVMNKVISDNLETTKKTKLPFF
jgi:hypothetical protein